MSLYSNIRNASPGADVFLGCLPLFSDLNQDQLSNVAERVQRRTFAAGVTLFHQDMPGMMLYMVEEGYVRITSIGRTGQELTLDINGPGDVFGELSILDRKSHSATAITQTSATVWLLSSTDLDDFFNRYPQVYQGMIHVLVDRVRYISHYAEAMTFQDVLGRLAYMILSLAERHGFDDDEKIIIQIPLTQGELASMVGATRESVNKAMSTLRAEELIVADPTHLAVLDTEGLRRMVEERGR
jgi:CRP-like cAMP-binding protein